MKKILITAFDHYGPWTTNASWLALVELTRDLPRDLAVVTRKYPVNLSTAQTLLSADLSSRFDYAIHMGQAPGSPCLALEWLAINAFADQPDGELLPLSQDGPAAFQTALPLYRWAQQLNAAGLPTRVSAHAGTYLCNALYYWNNFVCQREGYATQSVFIHVPLAPQQVAAGPHCEPSLATESAARAIRHVTQWLASDDDPSVSGDLHLL
jgi:pyroglutamyl-peptidase